MPTKKRAIVVGGDAAGMSAAMQMRRTDPQLEIEVFEKGKYVSYGACGIPYYIAGQIPSADELLAMSVEEFARRKIQVHTQCEITALRPGGRTVEGIDPSGKSFQQRYDYLVLATGGAARQPVWPGADLGGVFTLRNLQDGIALKEYLVTHKPRRAVVVGAGFLGLEMAEAFSKLGLEVELLARGTNLLSSFEAEFCQPVIDSLRANKVKIRFNADISALEADKGQVAAVVDGDKRYATDVVLMALGLEPANSLAKGARIALGRTGAIAVNERMKTNIPGIYAAGDCVELSHVVTGEKVFAPLALSANRSGRIAGANVAAEAQGKIGRQRFAGTAQTMICKVFEFELGQTGLAPLAAQRAGFDAVVFSRQSHSRAAYYPGGTPVSSRIVVDRRTRRLLGAQMIGQEGVAGRIDVFATALFKRMTIDEVYNLDLAYAPPFGPVYDPIIDICGKASIELSKKQ